MGGDDAKDVIKILPSVASGTDGDSLAKHGLGPVIVQPRLELHLADLEQAAPNAPAAEAAGYFHHILLRVAAVDAERV